MNAKTPAKDAHSVFEIWRREDCVLAARLDAIRKSMITEASASVSCCSAIAHSLTEFRNYLVGHFDAEDELTDQLAGFYSEAIPEIEAMKRQSDHDHQRLLRHLGELIDSFGQSPPSLDSWQDAIEKVDRFIDLLEQHEDQEAENAMALMPLKE